MRTTGKKHLSGNLMILCGAAMIASALCLMQYNIHASENAGTVSEKAVSEFLEFTDVKKNESGYVPNIPVKYSGVNENGFENTCSFTGTDGAEFTAVIEIPVLDRKLPVCSTLSTENLEKYPCRYSGSVSENNIIIAAHNYDSHFGSIKSLQNGDEIILTDVYGNSTVYTVTETEVIPGNAAGDMKAGNWNLTLFTCDLSGKNRITVRAVKI